MLASSTLLAEKTASSSAALGEGGEAALLLVVALSSSGDRVLVRPPPRLRLRLVSLHIAENGIEERGFDLEGNGGRDLIQGFINIWNS